MSKYEEQNDSSYIFCPYCNYKFEPEGGDISEDGQTEDCSGCGKKFVASVSYDVTYTATPDCELNGEQHVFKKHREGSDAYFCEVCDKCRIIEVKKEIIPEVKG